ncbi:hypothetical protein V5O48_000197 [Marasmius crinis-equi]|uniref:Uncharacterized protein n=1 Tax=Marasmius crinis-equi TaxID=585013 RepID=A0ABR3G1V8_9AGAR
METPSALPPHPRLRISRLSQSPFLDTTPQAGPSRFPDSLSPISNQYLHENDEHEYQEDTPKLTSSSLLPNVASNEHRNVEETPAERLRALLSQVPNDNTVKARPRPPIPQEPSSASTMDLIDSDSDVPQIGSAQPSFARESLKDLFSRALRDPDTPQKDARGRARRRNSIDTSEVEASPRAEKVQRDRSSNKGKRRSMSDDEVDPSISRDNSVDSDSFLRGLNSSQAPATSTPQHSMQQSLKMSVNSQFQSNLMDQDSEMQQAMNAFDSYEDSRSHAKNKSVVGPVSANEEKSVDPETQTSRRKSTGNLSSFSETPHSTHPRRSQSPRLKQATSSHAFPRSASPAVHAEASTSHSRTNTDIMHQREHSWNRHQPRPITPDLKHRHSIHGPPSRSASPALLSTSRRTLSRHSSSASIGSVDSLEDSTSQSGSVGSQAEYKELLKQRDTEKNHDRERHWNKPRPRTSSNASFNGLPERARTSSIPSRPTSRLSVSSPSFHHHYHRPSSRADSPTDSRMSIDSEVEREREEQHEMEHERERNWNSPRPHWDHCPIACRKPDRKSSLTWSVEVSQPTVNTSAFFTPVVHKGFPEFPFSDNFIAISQLPSSPELPNPISSQEGPLKNFKSSRTPLLDDSTSNIPIYRGHSRTLSSPSLSPHRSRSTSTRASLIPTPAKGKGKERQPPSSPSRERLRPSVSSSSIPTVIIDNVESDVQEEGTRVDEDHPTDTDEEGHLAQEKTPIIRPAASLPAESETEASTAEEPAHDPYQPEGGVSVSVSMSLTEVYSPTHLSREEERLQKVLSSPDSSFDDTTALRTAITSPPSPPPSPPSDAPPTPEEQPLPHFDLPSTPPRRASFSSSSLPFQTPTPPKGLPELPGPPSSDDDTDSAEDDGPQELQSTNTTALKTPKPPGAWSYTPAPQRQNGLLRSHSLPQLEEEPQHDSGLATPVPSLSRASSMPLKTPALPGGWMNTPYPKSVRFEMEDSVNNTDQSALVSDSSVEPESNLKQAAEKLKQLASSEADDEPKRVVKSEEDASTSSICTPPPSTSVSPKPKSPGRKINVLDEYGREIRDGDTKPKPKVKKEKRTSPSRSSIRIVDAMGREINDTQTEDPTIDENGEPISRSEALSRIREGLQDLQRGFDDDMQNVRDRNYIRHRIEELKAESEHAKHMRQRIQHKVLNEEELKNNFIEPLRASMRRSRISTPAPIRSSFWWMRSSWIYWLFFTQLLLIFLMYRISVSHAKHYFLTTFYDPYYPDLHLYHSVPDYPAQTISVTELFWREGLRASALQVLDNILIALSHWHNSAWRIWGTDDIHLATTWPPT